MNRFTKSSRVSLLFRYDVVAANFVMLEALTEDLVITSFVFLCVFFLSLFL